jgi:hypothetical protein
MKKSTKASVKKPVVKKAQTGATTKKSAPKMKFKTSENWADNYSMDTTGISSKNAPNYYPYIRSNGTKGAIPRKDAKEIISKVKSGKYKKSDWKFSEDSKLRSGGKLKTKKK